MDKWEYKVVKVPRFLGFRGDWTEGVETTLAPLGEEGWEAAGLLRLSRIYVLLKRPK